MGLVEHLRESATDLCSPDGCCYAESMVKAADEIERLRLALKSCAFVAEHGEPVDGSNFGSVREWIMDCCTKALE